MRCEMYCHVFEILYRLHFAGTCAMQLNDQYSDLISVSLTTATCCDKVNFTTKKNNVLRIITSDYYKIHTSTNNKGTRKNMETSVKNTTPKKQRELLKSNVT